MIVSKRTALCAALAASIVLAACSSTPVAPPMIAQTVTAVPAAAPSAMTGQAAAKSSVSTVIATTQIVPYLDPQSPLYKGRSVYFDFDQATVKPEYAPAMELHGKFLSAHPTVSIKIQGNTDEQGGAEYNLALGQKRAEAVLKSLKIYGVKESQMEAVSYGKEKPKALGHDEAALAQNRRADLDYPIK